MWRQRFFETSVMIYKTKKDCSFRKSHKCLFYIFGSVEQSSFRKLVVAYMVKRFHAFMDRSFITVFTKACHLAVLYGS